MENKLEELLNSLIEKGWCPFGKKDVYIETGEGYDFRDGFIVLKREKGGTYTCESEYMPYRMLCTKSSGLWQFVCENHLYIYKMGENKNFIQDHFKNEYNECCYQYLYDKSCYEYYLLESSLKDESELEDFLLNSISLHE